MSDRKRDTDFLKWLIGFGECDKCETLRCEFLKAEREEYQLRRTMTLMTVLTLLSITGLGYCVLFVPEWPGRGFPWLVRTFCALGLSGGISFLVAWGCWLRQRFKSNSLRDECREFIRTSLLMRLNLHDATEPQPREIRSQATAELQPVVALEAKA